MDRQRGRVVRGLDLGPRGGAGIVVGPKSNRRGAPPKTKRRRRRRSFHRAGQRGEGRRRARAERPYGGRHPRRRARPRAAQGREPGSNLAPGVAGSSRGCLLGEASRRGPPTTTGRIRVGDRRGRPRRHLRGGVATVRIVTVRVRSRVDDGSRHRPEARGGGPRARGKVGRVARRVRARAGGAPRETPRRRFVFHERSDAPRGRQDSARTRPRRARGSLMGRSRGGGGGSSGTSPRRRARRRSTRIGRRTTAGDAREGARERRRSRAGPCPRVVPEVGRTSGGASASPRAGTRASSTWWPCLRIREGPRREDASDERGEGARGPGGARAGAGAGRTSRASKHGRGAARGARGAPRAHPRPRTNPDLEARRINPRVGTSTRTRRATTPPRSGKATGWSRDRDARPRGVLDETRA